MIFSVVDWSGAKNPKGKIWLAEVRANALHHLGPLGTREAAVAHIAGYLEAGRSAVVGLDFSFSFPAWFCDQLGVTSGVDVWREAAAHGESWLEACAPPFWGRPGKRRPALPAHLRRTEALVGAALTIKPKSTFQIGGAGAVGTGSIRGMPYLAELRRAGCAVWPFDPPGRVTVVEVYPRALTGEVTKSLAVARRAYLRRLPWRMSEAQRRLAGASEDAFDAAVSALVLADRWSALGSQPRDRVTQMEGQIWVPQGLGQSRIASAEP